MDNIFVIQTDDKSFKEKASAFLSEHTKENDVNVAIYEMNPSGADEVMQIVKDKQSGKPTTKELTRVIARNLVAWDTSKDSREGLLPEVYLTNKYLYKQLTGEDYVFHTALKKFNIGD